MLSLSRLGSSDLDVIMVLGVLPEGRQVHTQKLYISNVMVRWTLFLEPDSILYAPMQNSKCFRLLVLTINVAVKSWLVPALVPLFHTPVWPSVLSTLMSIHNFNRNNPRPLSATTGFMALSEEQDTNIGGKPFSVLPVSEFLLVVALRNNKSYRIKQWCSLEKPTK